MKNTLRDLFLDQVSDMYDAEHRIIKALPKLAKAATCNQLKRALEKHLTETEGHAAKLEKVFGAFGEKPKAKKCKATVGLLDEGDEMVSDNEDSPTINAAIIAAGQKVEHYEIATYGTLHAWAMLLENEEAATLLEEILEEEKNADKALNDLSSEKNHEAMEADEEAEDSWSKHSHAAKE